MTRTGSHVLSRRAAAVAVAVGVIAALMIGCARSTETSIGARAGTTAAGTGSVTSTTAGPGSTAGTVGTTSPTGGGRAPSSPAPLPTRHADMVGIVASVTPFTRITTDCIDPKTLPPGGAVSSDDPPVCTDPDSDAAGSFVVEAPGADPSSGLGDKAAFSAATSTSVWREVAGTRSPASFAVLKVGQQVQVWLDGGIAESYPPQAHATAVLVIG